MGSVLDDMCVHDHFDDLGRGCVVGVDDIGGYLAIQLSSLVQQFEQLAANIAEQQRARGIETDALHSLRQTNPQPHNSVITKSRPGVGGQHRAATE